MNEIVAHQNAPIDVKAGSRPSAIVPSTLSAVWELADIIAASGMAPKDMKTKEQISVAIMHGLEVGLTPLAALQSIAVVNGRPSIWGDGALALVRASPAFESIKETMSGTGDDRRAVCVAKRRGEDPVTGEFSVSQAKTAGLWGKSGPWTQYPDRMLKMRARAFALRDCFADVLRGMSIAEESQDIVPMKDITPAAPPEPPAPTVEAAPADPQAGQQKPAAVQTVEKPSIDFEAWLSELAKAAAAAGDDGELRAVWNSVAAAYKQAPETIQKRANKVLNDRKKALAEPAQVVDAPAASEPLDGASFEAFLERFDKALSKAEAFDVLDALYAEQVDSAHEAGQISRAQIEGPIAKIYDKHRQRIDEDGFPGDRP